MAGKFEQPRNQDVSPSAPVSENQRRPYPPQRRRRKKRPSIDPKILAIGGLILLVLILLLSRCGKDEDVQIPADTQPAATETLATEPGLEVVSTASISVQGDLLMHRPVMKTCLLDGDTYDFSSLFQYIAPELSKYDYNIANLETTFGGPDYPYQGNPNFNAPDSLADDLKKTGFNMLLTGNNHCADTTTASIERTIQQLRSRGLTPLGTQVDADSPKYEIVDIGGIKVGMVCYTYATSDLNGLPVFNYRFHVTERGVVNYFTDVELDRLYTEMDAILADMEAQGAEITMAFMHWGTEYDINENDTQRAIAQKLCDMGVDVIVGGHPHVVQPMDLLTSSLDAQHKTVCIYSLGNAISNQRISEMDLKTGHTEDGVIFSVTFEKYSDGSVHVAGTDILPTWVNYHGNHGQNEYNILPLYDDQRDQWKDLFYLSGEQLVGAQNSYERTMSIVEAGLKECQDYLAQARSERIG